MQIIPTPQTPSSITDEIVRFCSELDAGQTPFYIPITPSAGAGVNECHLNVRNQIDKEGGDQQFGWILWIVKDHWIEADFHSIHVRPDGSLADVTPDPDGETHRLFLPDSERTWTPNSGVGKRYWPLSDRFETACRYFEAAEQIRAEIPVGRQGTPLQSRRYMELFTKAQLAILSATNRTVTGNGIKTLPTSDSLRKRQAARRSKRKRERQRRKKGRK